LLVAQSHQKQPQWWRREDVLARALRDFNLASMSEFTLKPEQESAVTALLAGRAVPAVLPTGYGKKSDSSNVCSC
jgi:superfamily II DNA or RNA helicase